jgi:hypothetical protein
MNMFNYFAGLWGVVKSEKLQTFQTKENTADGILCSISCCILAYAKKIRCYCAQSDTWSNTTSGWQQWRPSQAVKMIRWR